MSLIIRSPELDMSPEPERFNTSAPYLTIKSPFVKVVAIFYFYFYNKYY